jgi:hypothetical protein
MGLGRYVVDTVLLEGQSPGALARRHGISRSWVCRLLERYRDGGYAALEPRSRRPLSCSHLVTSGVRWWAMVWAQASRPPTAAPRSLVKKCLVVTLVVKLTGLSASVG